jgi:hypothetical protein
MEPRAARAHRRALALYRQLVATFADGEDAEIDQRRGWAERRVAALDFRRRERIARRLMLVAALVLAGPASSSRPRRA